MKKINRLMTNLCSGNLPASRDFYVTLFDLELAYDSDWFVHLVSKNNDLELGIIDETNEIVPKELQAKPNGFYLTFVVDNVDDIYEIAQSSSFKIIDKPKDLFYGQRRLLLKDPNGILIDVSSPIKDS